MSAKIAPENVSVGVTLASRAFSKPAPTSRPIEDAGALAADSNPRRNHALGRKLSDGNKAEPGMRPPGKDPSVLPQSLFDAALIAAEHKPQTHQPKPEAPTADLENSDARPQATNSTTLGDALAQPLARADSPADARLHGALLGGEATSPSSSDDPVNAASDAPPARSSSEIFAPTNLSI